VFVMPCITTPDGQVDGIPNVVPEAMATGLPVVASDLPALRELVTDGIDGLLAPPGDAAAIASAVERVLTEPGLAASIGAAGREVVLQRFDVEANVDQLVRLLWPDQLVEHQAPIEEGVA
jgi:glycosyltransferase involved in cell wall biosynthesis